MSESKIEEVITILWGILAALLWGFKANQFLIIFVTLMSLTSAIISTIYAISEIKKHK